MSAAVVTSFFNDYGGNVIYGKNGGSFTNPRTTSATTVHQAVEPRRHSSSLLHGVGGLPAHHHHHHPTVANNTHHQGLPQLRRSTSAVTPSACVLRPQATTSPKPPCARMTVAATSPPGINPNVANPNCSSSCVAVNAAAVAAAALAQNNANNNVTREHRKLDRSYSEPVVDRRGSVVGVPAAAVVPPTSPGLATAVPPSTAVAAQNSSRYKTELCRPFEESGTCKYGDKCQFAHGGHELRTLARHPKYKTELCRTFHTTGFCPYGPRCHFIHNSDESRKSLLNNLHHNPPANSSGGQQPQPQPHHVCRPKALSVGSFASLGSAGDLSPPSSPLFDDAFGGNYTPSSAASSSSNTAFSFSQDFATLVQSPSPLKINPTFPTFGGSQPALATTTSFSAIKLPSAESAFQFPPATVTINGGGPLRVVPAGIVEGPPSPVDSLGSEMDNMSVSGGSPAPATCSSPLSRLPIFNRLAHGRDSD
ncbi:unnamed protein product [Ixodes persulcatus]